MTSSVFLILIAMLFLLKFRFETIFHMIWMSNQVEDYFNIFAAFSECPNFIAKFSYEMIDKKCLKPPHFCFDIFIAVL